MPEVHTCVLLHTATGWGLLWFDNEHIDSMSVTATGIAIGMKVCKLLL
ncbi:hypothetical protein FLA_2276 [Filimonas lacunae]|nr:hypothetical protein FLA_2276 [Filimonas lacunae]